MLEANMLLLLSDFKPYFLLFRNTVWLAADSDMPDALSVYLFVCLLTYHLPWHWIHQPCCRSSLPMMAIAPLSFKATWVHYKMIIAMFTRVHWLQREGKAAARVSPESRPDVFWGTNETWRGRRRKTYIIFRGPPLLVSHFSCNARHHKII